MKWILAFTLVFFANIAAAQDVGECDWRASAYNIGEPWSEYTRTFSNGKTRIALMDAGEPALGSVYILVLSPPYNEMGERQCRILSYSDSIGFLDLDFSGIQAQYDPSIGLGFAIPGVEYVPETDGQRPMYLLFTLNQATGVITPRIERVGG